MGYNSGKINGSVTATGTFSSPETLLSHSTGTFAGASSATLFTVPAGHRYVIKNISLAYYVGAGGTIATLKINGVTILSIRIQSSTATHNQKYDYGDIIATEGQTCVIAGDGYCSGDISYVDEVV